MRNKVFIVVVTYNAMQWLPKCLESTKPYNVIIVDNNSQDNTIKYIEKEYPEVKLFKLKKNIGFGQANNIGISYALKEGADFLFLLNQDAYLHQDCIESLLIAQKKYPGFGILSPLHFNGHGKKLDVTFAEYLVRYDVYKDIIADYGNNSIQHVYEIGFVNAAAWLISRKALNMVGGFDSLFFHYGEDRNYCQRICFHGFMTGIVPTAKISHDRQSREEKQIIKFSREYYQLYKRNIKVEWADVNREDFDIGYGKIITYQTKRIYKNILLLKFKYVQEALIKRRILIALKDPLVKSRKRNKHKDKLD